MIKIWSETVFIIISFIYMIFLRSFCCIIIIFLINIRKCTESIPSQFEKSDSIVEATSVNNLGCTNSSLSQYRGPRLGNSTWPTELDFNRSAAWQLQLQLIPHTGARIRSPDTLTVPWLLHLFSSIAVSRRKPLAAPTGQWSLKVWALTVTLNHILSYEWQSMWITIN